MTVFIRPAGAKFNFINNIIAVGGTIDIGEDVTSITIPDSALGLPYPGGGTYQGAIEKIMIIDTTTHIGGVPGGIHTGSLTPVKFSTPRPMMQISWHRAGIHHSLNR